MFILIYDLIFISIHLNCIWYLYDSL